MVITKPLVSIIIPTKNSSRTLASLLKSISKQKGPSIEIIVVDNYSSDQTREIALKWAAHILLARCERSKARNLGAKLARGDYLLFLDSDMELADNVVDSCFHIASNGKFGACIIREISTGEGYWAKVRSLERQTYEGGSLFETAMFFRKDVFISLGGFSENLVGFEDYDLQVRLEKTCVPIGYSSTPIFHNEGKLELGEHLMKKRYYVRAGKNYIYENRQRSFLQFLPIKYTFFKNRALLWKKPACAVGVVVLKSLEVVVGILSILS